MMNKLIILIEVFLVFLINKSSNDFVALKIEETSSSSNHLSLCAIFKGPSYLNESVLSHSRELVDLTKYDACNSVLSQNENVNSKAVWTQFKKTTKCNLSTMANSFQFLNASFVIAYTNLKINLNSLNGSPNLPFLFLPDKKVEEFFDRFDSVVVSFKRLNFPFDVSILVVISLAYVTAIVGAAWNRVKFLNDVKNEKTTENEEKKTTDTFSERLKRFTFGYFTITISFLVFMFITLNLIFYEYVGTWILLILFIILALFSLWRIFYKSMGKLPFLKYQIPIKCLKNPLEIRIFISKVCCITIVLVWSLNLTLRWAWVLQDIMVLAISLNALSLGLFKSYRFIVLISIIFILYDTFMIFILPIFLKEDYKIASSICFGIKTSYDSKFDQIDNVIDFNQTIQSSNSFPSPFYLIIPNILNIKTICNQYFDYPFTIMGIGEIIIPGLNLNYALLFDISNNSSTNNKYLYFLINLIGYVIGSSIVGILVSFINSNQPVLLFTSSILIFLNILTSKLKNDFDSFWYGITIQKYMFNEQKTSE